MRRVTIQGILLFVLCSVWLASSLWSRPADVGGSTQLIAEVTAAFPQECREQRYCILLTSVQRCVGCGVAAVNGTIGLLRQIDSSVVCVVVLAAEDRREADVVRQKFLTPFFLVDTTSALRSPDKVQQYPELLIVDTDGTVLYHRNDLQHSDPEYLTIRQALTATPAADISTDGTAEQTLHQQNSVHRSPAPVQQKTTDTGIYLSEPDTHPISRLISPVYSPGGQQLSAINTLTNSIDTWRTTDGTFISSVVLPDSIRYRFRLDSMDWRWRDMEKQGNEVAKFRSLVRAGDTLYALVDILAGYTRQTTVGKTPAGTIDSMVYITWQSRQLILRLYNNTFLGVLEPTGPSTLIELCPLAGTYGGTSLWKDFTAHRSVAEQRDSLQCLMWYRGEPPVPVKYPLIQKMQHVMVRTGDTAFVSIGKIAAAGNTSLWYCAPENGLLVYLQLPDRLHTVVPQGKLQQCAGSILLGDKATVAGVYRKAEYRLAGITPFNDNISLLLVSTPDSSARARYILQYYSSNGSFLGESQPDEFHTTGSIESIVPAGTDSRDLVFLTRTERRWKLVRIPLPTSDAGSVSQDSTLAAPAR